MVKKRNKVEIVNDILSSIQHKGEIKPTHIMYKSNLSHKLLNSYLEELMEKELVSVEEEEKKKRQKGSRVIVITEKGLGFLEEFRRMREFTNAFGL